MNRLSNIPIDLRAEALLNYLPEEKWKVELKGSHKRNAYDDVLSVNFEEDEIKIELSRDGLYDILPEALFHPVDRFENIPPHEYKERFTQECEQQQSEEINARKYFRLFDNYILDLNCELDRIKEETYEDNSFLSNILCDSLSENYSSNRFIKNLIPFIPFCSKIRGNIDFITLILRKILKDENISLNRESLPVIYKDENPQYNHNLDTVYIDQDTYYLGNEYIENVTIYEIKYWNESECNERFLDFVSEIDILEQFINDYFVGIESLIKFKISAIALPTRLSDKLYYNYLDYNTNL